MRTPDTERCWPLALVTGITSPMPQPRMQPTAWRAARDQQHTRRTELRTSSLGAVSDVAISTMSQ